MPEGPPVFRCKVRLTRDPKTAKTSLKFPVAISRKLDGMETIEGTINGHPFRAPLENGSPESRALRVNQAMLRGSRGRAGDTVELAVLGPESKLVIPADLRAAFQDMPEVLPLWKDLTDLGRRDWVRWILGAKTPETRAKRIRRTIEQLAEGKRRPCCVNFYEFMLQRVQQTSG